MVSRDEWARDKQKYKKMQIKFLKAIDKPNIFWYNSLRHEEIFLWYAAMAQLVEHILGKDEVPSSNLGSSSRKTPIVRSGLLVFYGAFGFSGAATQNPFELRAVF